jgi:D-beta-D-heptose 7-phosphate kinase/D-beta-D-heptose 1-phosphate adenosyltransferase
MVLNTKQPNIIIIGDIMLDHNIYGTISKLANEAPIPVLNKKNEIFSLGGCGNVLTNLYSLGCNNLFLFSMIGNDKYGEKLETILNRYNIKYSLIKDNSVTTVKHRFFSDKKILFRYDEEDYRIIQEDDENYIYTKFLDTIENNSIDSIVFSDYNKGFLTDTLCQRIIKKANEKNIFTIVDPKDNYEKYKFCSLIKPNRNEVKKLFDIDFDIEEIHDVLIRIKNKVNSKYVVITLAEKGISYLNENNKHIIFNTDSIDVIDVTGAGDIVNSIISYYFPFIIDKEYIIKLSSYVASKSVSHAGTYVIQSEDILLGNRYLNDNKLITFNEIKFIKKKVIFTNGCFDILHKGHLELFKFCKENIPYDGIFIVGLNSDSSIKRLKGDKRPFNSIDLRVQMLNSIKWIDYIIVFEEDSPVELLKLLKPDTIVKGGDYTVDSILGKEFCKEVKIFNTVEGYSTTNIINKLNLTDNSK